MNVPDSERQLLACNMCSIILSKAQWDKMDCPNACSHPDPTPYFKGMISLLAPSGSWVARFNNLKGRAPGIYAMQVDNAVQQEEDLEAAE